jgi:hypothetical protein
MRIGAHFHQTISPRCLDLYSKAGMNAAKLMHYHTATDIKALRDVNPNTSFLMRLPDSVLDDGSIPSYQTYAQTCARVVNRMWPDVADYELDNEPNVTWAGKIINGRPATQWD